MYLTINSKPKQGAEVSARVDGGKRRWGGSNDRV